jgi:hypothetical protein
MIAAGLIDRDAAVTCRRHFSFVFVEESPP